MDRETRGYLAQQRCQCNTKKYECLFAYLPIVFPPPYCVLRPFRKTHWASFTLCLFCNSSWSCVRERFARPGWIISTTNYSQKARWRQSRWHLEHDNKIGTNHYTCYIVESMYLLAAEERIPDELPLANARGVRHDCRKRVSDSHRVGEVALTLSVSKNPFNWFFMFFSVQTLTEKIGEKLVV